MLKNCAKRHMRPLHINFWGIEKVLGSRGGGREEKYLFCKIMGVAKNGGIRLPQKVVFHKR